MKWSAEFQPRSLCSFSDGGPDSSSGDTSSGGADTSGFFSGNTTGGDFFGGGGGSFQGTNDAGGFVNTAPDVSGGQIFSTDAQGGQTFADNALTGGGGQVFGGDPFGGGVNFAPNGGGGGMNFSADFGGFQGGMAPTAGVDFTGGGQGFGVGGPASWGGAGGTAATYANTGLNNAVGPPGAFTGNFGTYGTGGPTSTGFGSGAGPSVGGPTGYYAAAPGVTGFSGDFGAAPGGSPLGMPMSEGDVGPQAGGPLGAPQAVDPTDWVGPGGFPTVQPGEAFPGGRGEPPAAPTVAPDQRGENFFGPESIAPTQTASASMFGPSQAQAASRGTDTAAIMAQSDPFAQVADMASRVSQTNPDLAQALMGIVANQNTQTNMVGPMMTGFEGPTPGAQQGFTGVSTAQSHGGLNAAPGQQGFTGQPAALSESTQGKGDRGDTTPMTQVYPGVQPGSLDPNANTFANPALQEGLDTRADALRGDLLAPEPQQDTFDSRFGNLPPAQPQQDTFDSRFGNLPPAEQAQPDTFDSRFGDPSQFTPTPQDQPDTRTVSPDVLETIARSGPELTTGLIGPLTQGVGREAAPLGLLSMMQRSGGEAAPFGGGGRSGAFGPSTGGRSGGPGLSITVGNNQFAGGRSGGTSQGGRSSPGYYMTGGAGIAPGAKGAEYGGIYGPGVATGRPGTNTFGIDSRSGAQGFYDARTGLYYR